PSLSSNSKDSPNVGFKPLGEEEKMDTKNLENENSAVPNTEEPRVNQEQDESINITNNNNIVSLTVNTDNIEDNALDKNIVNGCIDDPNMPNLEEIAYSDDDEEVGAEADMNNLAITVWTLMDLPHGKRAIGTKWVYRNKKDERGIVIRNKARLVTQRYTQEKGIDYDEVFAPFARIKAIRLFLAYASFKDFVVYQMDVKSAFLYGKIEEEIYVCQPPGFEDPKFLDKVYKVEKRGQIDKTLFIKRVKGDILLVQVYVDDIIFGSTKKGLCTEFEKLMQKKFEMSSMGELTFFLGLFQVTPKDSHLHAVKRIFGYFIGQPKLGLWYPKDSPFDLEAYTDSDYAGVSLDKKSTIGAAKNEIQVSAVRVTYYRKAKRTTEISQSSGPILLVSDETVIKEWEDRMERATTTTSSLEAEQDSGSGPMCQDTILGGAEAQIRFEAASKQSNDPPLSRVNTLGSEEDNMKLKELIEFCTKLSVRALDL
ncbi:putative ribonuclease H-like domain-containing protein, partial [Tanacetum coccineum]